MGGSCEVHSPTAPVPRGQRSLLTQQHQQYTHVLDTCACKGKCTAVASRQLARLEGAEWTGGTVGQFLHWARGVGNPAT